jgi:uncharacterized protein YdeI (YjbR/CyaY-like superfamily)
MAPKKDLLIMGFESADRWQAWLEDHHASSDGIWLKVPKRDGSGSGVSYAAALEVAICYGWIDGQKGKLDDDYWLQRFTPRKPGGRWSKINTEKATELIGNGRMRAAGLREIEAAKADGRWDAAYQPQSRATVPDDLQQALDVSPAALATFAGLDGHSRYVILYRVGNAKPANRGKRIDEFITMLAAGKKPGD